MIKKCLPLLLAVVLTGQPALAATNQRTGVNSNANSNANSIVSSISRVDLSSGRIAGEKAEFFLDIPTMWQGYLTADREKTMNENPLERLCFSYPTIDKNAKPIPFLVLEVYDKARYTLAPGFRKLLESDHYVFTVRIEDGAALTNPTDKAIFGVLASNASDDRYLISLLRLKLGEEKIYSDTIWVNGRQLNEKALTDGELSYLPLRGVCEALRYEVQWNAELNAVTLRKGVFFDILFLNDVVACGGYVVFLNEQKCYIPALYFITRLNLNLEIDERGTVFLNE
jgi:hypothetical protein